MDLRAVYPHFAKYILQSYISNRAISRFFFFNRQF